MLKTNVLLTILKQSSFLFILLCAVALAAVSKPAYAQISDFKITASDGAEQDRFGGSVSISGDYAVVGAHLDDITFSDQGSAYIYKRTGTSWVQEAKLLLTDGTESDQFGFSVSISGDYAVVGTPNDDLTFSDQGSAYIFKRTGTSWAQEAQLFASDGASPDHFGWSVSISGDYAVVGAILHSTLGSAYIFKRTGTSWAQEAKLVASDGVLGDQFGISVSISGDLAAIGAWGDDDNGSESGSAYIFKRTGTSWAQEAKLLASDGAEQDRFGGSVSISGDYAVVGAESHDINGIDDGSAYIFKRTGTSWAQETQLLPSDGAAKDYFGKSVSISGDLTVIGAAFDDDNGSLSGSAYIFKRAGTTWTQEAKLLPSDGAAADFFGFSVSIDSNHAVVGANSDDDDGSASGSAYLFNLHDPFMVNPIQDVALDEDFGTIIAVVLDTVFNDLDLPDKDSLRFSVVLSNSILMYSFSGDTLFLHSVGDSNGVAQVIVTATDDSEAALSDTFSISITLVNDAPMFVEFPDSVEITLGEADTLILSEYTFDADDPDSVLIWSTLDCIGSDSIACVTMNADTAFIQTIGDIAGFQELTFLVTDTSGASDTASVIIYVKAPVGIAGDGIIPLEYSLANNYPNPFNPQTTISYGLPKQSDLSLIIYNIMGQEIMRWDEQNSQAGFYQKIWNGRNKFGAQVGSGVYFYRIIAGDFVKTRKMVLLK